MVRRRVLAGAVDVAVVIGWVAVVVGGAWALSASVGPGPLGAVLSGLWEGLVAAAVILPVSLVGAWADWSRGTPGKRWQDLQVRRAAGGRAGFARCLARDALKYALPLAFVQAVVLVAVGTAGRWPAQVWVLAGLAVVLVGGYVAGALLGDQTALYDAMTGTRVRERVGRRVAEDEPGGEPEPALEPAAEAEWEPESAWEPELARESARARAEAGEESYTPRRAL